MSGRMRRETLPGEVHHLVLDRDDSAVNLLDGLALRELEAHLWAIEKNPRVRGLVISSAKEAVFCAGADVRELDGVVESGDGEALREAVRLGWRVLLRLSRLRIPTAAAIHGACLGGGLELALACGARVASDDPATRLGLPEVRLGILPAWGGSTRAPRLLGVPAALSLVLSGRPWSAGDALRRGLVDGIVPRERLVEAAAALLRAGEVPRPRHRLANLRPVASAAAAAARARARRAAGGRYPAPLRAAGVVAAGPRGEVADGLDREEAAVVALARTPESRALVRLFLLQEEAKREPPSAAYRPAPWSVAVVGAGTMGAAIAAWAASRGGSVLLRDRDPESVRAGMARVASLLLAAERKGVLGGRERRRALDRVVPEAAEVPLWSRDLVLEAVPEDLAVKRQVLAAAAVRVRPGTLLATNTSSLSVGALAEGLPEPGALVGIHFFHPVHRMPLVEVVAGPRTDPAAVDRAAAWVRALGKVPVVVRDRPGFLVNRVLAPYFLEAVRLLEEGMAARRVDRALVRFGMPAGPVRLLDEVGLDVALHAAESMAAAFGDRLAPPALVRRLVEAGRTGRKSGRGFLEWRGRRAPRPAPLPGVARGAPPAGEDLADRLVLPLVNEAVRCLEEGIADGPGAVDLAVVLGTGFAPFRGGPLRHADALGAAEVVRRLEALAAQHGPRFAPCALLRAAAEEGFPLSRDPVTPRGPAGARETGPGEAARRTLGRREQAPAR